MVRDEMKFIGVKDFYIKCRVIRKKYRLMRLDEKWKYKYYVYSRPLLIEYYKDVIWEYLNDFAWERDVEKCATTSRI